MKNQPALAFLIFSEVAHRFIIIWASSYGAARRAVR